MPVLDPILSLSSRQEAFCNHYHDKTRVNMTFRDTPQQPACPAGVVPDGAERRSGISGRPPRPHKAPAQGRGDRLGLPPPLHVPAFAARGKRDAGRGHPPGGRFDRGETRRTIRLTVCGGPRSRLAP